MNRLNGMICYLAGPMDRIEGGGVEWRRKVTPRLHDMGLGVLDPTNKPLLQHQENDATRKQVAIWKENGEFDKVRDHYKPIVGVDLRFVDQSSFILLHINTDEHMCGSYDEAFMAALQRKPVVVMCDQGKKNVPNWMFGRVPHEMFFGSWDEVFEYLRHVDEDEDVDHMRRWTFMDYGKIYGNPDFNKKIPFHLINMKDEEIGY